MKVTLTIPTGWSRFVFSTIDKPISGRTQTMSSALQKAQQTEMSFQSSFIGKESIPCFSAAGTIFTIAKAH
jgi:hypothetical protein